VQGPGEDPAAVERALVLENFASKALDWPIVRNLIVPHAVSAIGERALMELTPRGEAEAREALLRTREMFEANPDDMPPLGGLQDPWAALEEAQRYSRTLDGEGLLGISRLLRVVEDLGHWLAGRRGHLPESAALWVGLPNLRGMRGELERALDDKGRLVDDASPLLKKLAQRCAHLDRTIDVRMRELAANPAWKVSIAEGHFGRVHRRGGRRVLAVRQRHVGRIPGIVHDRSKTGETLFVEPREVVQIANELNTVRADRQREESRILLELTRSVLLQREPILFLLERVAELELALIGARYARAVGGAPPRLPGEPGAAKGLLLRGFRHPLLLREQELGHLDQVVPIDLRLGEEFNLLLITGPNTGGKTLAIKSAGLACLMGSMGLALPCEPGTTIPLFDGIVADIGDEQEIRQNLSTFSSHLKRIHQGLVRATPRTLFLLDELGGGTDPSEGAALGEAILEHLLEMGIPAIASTHLGKLKEFAFRFQRAENAHVEFDLETLAPRYRLVIGAPGESRALAIARRLGFPEELVSRGTERLERIDGETRALMEELREVRLGAERQRAMAEQKLIDAERGLVELGERRDEVDRKGEQLEAEAQRNIEERLSNARRWLERLHALLSQLPPDKRGLLEPALRELEVSLTDASLSDKRRAFVAGLKKGATVFLPRFKKRCEVTRVYKAKRELDVRMGKHVMRVAFDDVTFYESL
jgi:DNA mismatch repair protein MutS2